MAVVMIKNQNKYQKNISLSPLLCPKGIKKN